MPFRQKNPKREFRLCPTWQRKTGDLQKLNLKLFKTGVINDLLDQTHSHASSEHCFLLFCFSRFEKWGRTYGQTDNMIVRKQLSLPALTLAWLSGSKTLSLNLNS